MNDFLSRRFIYATVGLTIAAGVAVSIPSQAQMQSPPHVSAAKPHVFAHEATCETHSRSHAPGSKSWHDRCCSLC